MTTRRAASVPRAAALVLTALALALTGCTASGDSTPSAPSSGSAAPAQDISPRPRSDLRAGGDLRLPVDALPTNYNPIQVNGARVITWQLAEALLPSAFRDAPNGGQDLNTDFFADIELVSTSPQTIRYDIAPGATWSNGRPLTWEDLDAQAKALSGKDDRFEGYSTVGYADIASVARGTSDQQAVVTLARPFAEWQGLFNILVPKEVTSDPVTFNSGWVESPQITAGPFEVEKIDATGKTVTLRRNPSFWAEKAVLDRVIFRVLDPAARADELANGGIDLYPIGGDIDLFTRAEGIPGVEVRRAPERLAGQLTFNGAPGAPLGDEPLRRAVAQAVDPQAVTDVLMGRIVPGAKAVGNHILPPSHPGYRDNSATLPASRAAAEKALDALGWTRDGAVRSKDGKRLTLRLIAPATPVGRTVTGVVRDQLAAAGIEAQVDTLSLDTFYDQNLLVGKFDIAAFEWTKSASPFAHDRPVFQQPKGEDFGSNFGRVWIPEIDALYDRGLAELDTPERQQIANQIDVLAWKHAHHLPLYPGSGAYAVRENLANYGARGLAAYRFDDAGFAK